MKQHEKWLLKAENDLKAAKILINNDNSVLDAAVYHCHQTAEKALKAYLVYKKREIIKTHDLRVLLMECSKEDKDFETLFDISIELTPYSTEFRYPGINLFPDIEDVEVSVKYAEQILVFVHTKIL